MFYKRLVMIVLMGVLVISSLMFPSDLINKDYDVSAQGVQRNIFNGYIGGQGAGNYRFYYIATNNSFSIYVQRPSAEYRIGGTIYLNLNGHTENISDYKQLF